MLRTTKWKKVIPAILVVGLIVIGFPNASEGIFASKKDNDSNTTVWEQDFESKEPGMGTFYHADIVSSGASSDHAVKIGRDYKDNEDSLKKGSILDRGSFTAKVPVEPNSTYQFTTQARVDDKGSLVVGVMDFENERYWKPKDASEEVKSGEWTDVSVELTTGPRTDEVAFYGLLDDHPGPGYLDNMKVDKVADAASSNKKEDPTEHSTPNMREDEFPVTIPGIQKFESDSNKGKWKVKDSTRILVDENDAESLMDDAELFASELFQEGYTTNPLKVEKGDSTKAKSGDIVFSIEELEESDIPKAGDANDEAYQLNVNNENLSITGASDSGVFNGTRTILQALKEQKWLPGGTVTDWTENDFRGMQLDTGRRYYSVGWLKQQIKDLSWTKMNTLHLRIKDDQGLRVESDVAPEMVTDNHYTKDEIHDLVTFADKYHVTIIPEVDVPGHSYMDATVHPDYALELENGEVSACGTSKDLDYTKPSVRKYIKGMDLEMAELFQSPYFHLGGDELCADGDTAPQLTKWAKEQLGSEATWYDGWEYFFNQRSQYLKDKGIKPIVWNDQFEPEEGIHDLDKDIMLDFWAKYGRSPQADKFDEAGYKLINNSSDLYNDLWPDKIGTPEVQMLYEKWGPKDYSGGFGEGVTLPEDSNGHAGAMFPIWDDPHGWPSEYWVSKQLMPRIRSFAQKAWGSPKSSSNYADFDAYINEIGRAPSNTTNDIIAKVDRLEQGGEFANHEAVHALQLHLTTVKHFEKKGSVEKVTKHLNGFKSLLKKQKKDELISEESYDALQADTDDLIELLAPLKK